MLKYYFTYYWRSIQNNKVLFFINILGLAGGMAGSLILFLWVVNESGQDRFHKHAEAIHLIMSNPGGTKDFRPNSAFAKPRPELFESITGIENYTHINILDDNIIMELKNQKTRTFGLTAPPSFYEIFSFPVVEIDSQLIIGKNYVFLTQKLAKKIFREKNPVGEVVTLYHEKINDLTVAGILKNPPSNSSLQFEFIANYEAAQWSKMGIDYLKLNDQADIDHLNDQIKDLGQKSTYANANFGELKLFPFTDIYFESEFSSFPHGEKKYIYILSVVGSIILLIALFNYFNLSISQSLTRMKSIGIKRIMGMSNANLLQQFSVESMVNFLIVAFMVPLLLFPLSEEIEAITGEETTLLNLRNIQFEWYFLALPLLFILLALFIYIYFKSGTPLVLLKKQILDHRKTINLKSNLVIIQFIIASVVVIATIVIGQQTEYMISMDPGYAKENIVRIQFNQSGRLADQEQKRKNFEYVRDQIRSYSSIVSFDFGNFPTESTTFMWNLRPDSLQEAENIAMLPVSDNFHQVFDLEIIHGQPFSETSNEVIINETAVKEYQIKHPVGKTVEAVPWGEFKIVGVVEDFHFENLSQTIKPLVVASFPYPHRPLVLRIASGKLRETMGFLETLYQKVNPGLAFEYEFFDDHVQSIYQRDLATSRILNLATIFVFLLSGVGLFSLSVVYTMQKTKEIGIRKVMGATVGNILAFLSKYLTRWVGISILIAIPISYYFLQTWLNNFAYRIDLSWGYFVIAGIATLSLALLVISYQTIKAAYANPVDSLRDE